MNDLKHLMETVARPDTESISDTAADLDRARTALRHQRRRVYALGLGALTALAVLGAGSAAVVIADRDETPSAGQQGALSSPSSRPTRSSSSRQVETAPTPTATPTPEQRAPIVAKDVQLVAETMEAGPYTFGTTPQGWVVQNNQPFAVTIGRADDPDTDAASFEGKLVILLDDLALGGGTHETRDGRDLVFRDNGDGYSTVSVATRPGEPQGVVRIQFPADVGWTRDAALTFLSSVRVGPDAEVVHG